MEPALPWSETSPSRRHTSFAVGGPADLSWWSRTSIACSRCCLARACGVPWTVLGRGTNMLVADEGIRGLVMVNAARGYRSTEMVCWWPPLGRHCANWHAGRCGGLAGLEWAVGIPGTLGGAVVGNAGAYGGCMADCVRGRGCCARMAQ